MSIWPEARSFFIAVVYLDREGGQARAEGGIVLQGEDRGRNKHGNLLTVGSGLERCADGYFRLAKAYIAADQAVHGEAFFHIALDRTGGLFLIRCVLIHERGFELGL